MDGLIEFFDLWIANQTLKSFVKKPNNVFITLKRSSKNENWEITT